jgi:UPF0755 protein
MDDHLKKLLLVAALFIGLILFIGIYFINVLNTIPDIDKPLQIEIPKNTGINKAIDIMNESSLLKPGVMFKLAAKAYSLFGNQHIYAGTYLFNPGTSNIKIFNAIFSGKYLNIVIVTFPEGITLDKFAEILELKAGINRQAFLELASDSKFLQLYGIEAPTAEGYLMPDTYQFYRNQNPRDVLHKLLIEQKQLWDESFTEKAKAKGWGRHKALTMASIIEAETPVEDERKIISGVYHNRLLRGMLLQADPTVQYAIGSHKQRLKYSDLGFDSPYNTYLYKGLPPGPINSPGKSSIEAALEPEKHNYLYFVATGDGTGRHNFARNAAEHGRYKAEYKRNLRKQ